MGDPGFLPAQFETVYGALERAFEKDFGLLESVFVAGIEQLGHAVRFSRAEDYAASGGGSEVSRCRAVTMRTL